AYCGIVGLKPTYGLVSTRGVVPLSWSLDHIGPMCRTVEDAALLLQEIAGYDARDTNSIEATIPEYSKAMRREISTIRIGTPQALFYDVLDPEIGAAMSHALEVLKRMAASVNDVVLPGYEPLPLLGAEAYTFHERYVTKTPELYLQLTRQRI